MLKNSHLSKAGFSEEFGFILWYNIRRKSLRDFARFGVPTLSRLCFLDGCAKMPLQASIFAYGITFIYSRFAGDGKETSILVQGKLNKLWKNEEIADE